MRALALPALLPAAFAALPAEIEPATDPPIAIAAPAIAVTTAIIYMFLISS